MVDITSLQGDNTGKLYQIETTQAFIKWFKGVRNIAAKRRFLARFAMIENGNFGDHKVIDRGLSELRFFFGSGYRIYYTIKAGRAVLLLSGGDKSSQARDIKAARKILEDIE